jgi:hypothetical protein
MSFLPPVAFLLPVLKYKATVIILNLNNMLMGMEEEEEEDSYKLFLRILCRRERILYLYPKC